MLVTGILVGGITTYLQPAQSGEHLEQCKMPDVICDPMSTPAIASMVAATVVGIIMFRYLNMIQ